MAIIPTEFQREDNYRLKAQKAPLYRLIPKFDEKLGCTVSQWGDIPGDCWMVTCLYGRVYVWDVSMSRWDLLEDETMRRGLAPYLMSQAEALKVLETVEPVEFGR